MSESTNRYLKFVYYFGVFFGLFTFTFNLSTKNFELSKKLQIYNKVVATIILIVIIRLSFSNKSTIPSDNMVIQIATPINFSLAAAILLNAYILLQSKEQEIVTIMNFGLGIKNIVTKGGEHFKMSFKFFMKTFALDGIFFIFLILLLYRGLFVLKFSKIAFAIVFFLQYVKNISRFMTHLYIYVIDVIGQLSSNIQMKVKESIKQFERFLEDNPEHTKYQLIKNCCKLSDEMDNYAIQGKKILTLMNGMHFLFSGHILLMIAFNMTDILILVSRFFCFVL